MVFTLFRRRYMRAAILCLAIEILVNLLHVSGYIPPRSLIHSYDPYSPKCVSYFSPKKRERPLRAEGTPVESKGLEQSGDLDATSSEVIPAYLPHEPVLLEESIDLLVTNPDGRYLDVTFGYGGHAEAILERLSSKGTLVAVDRDPEAIYNTSRRLEKYVTSGQLIPIIGTFSSLKHVLKSQSLPIEGYTGILADLGLSTHQLESAKRGFAYNCDGPLDMRMSNPNHDPFRKGMEPSSLETSNTVFKLINRGREYDIAHIIREYGEEPRASIIARRIVDLRQRVGGISTTFQLRDIVLGCVRGNHKVGMKTLSRVFQALRIYVNDELYELESLLDTAPSLLHRKHGRLAVISYHSLEDRAVKRVFSDLQASSDPSSDISVYRVLTKKCVTPTREECRTNQKARSAKLRCVERYKYKPTK
ncbi:Ribosomal RNA small subunit methyltransferase H [Babesia sp. Xinjiang]|uniref:Ribosomal RNA small subunit methyltransferase H n=1 Tax=Babesia sp. Xinjiang TaxID=462227 RepID=UPI000A2206AA|nr:Ribosomal RNA small subunit methyltransferase H [Babesia sp. Xinjiang]ORM40375.1 Ribosomal RNA small subunit methyltransferase H [Babesia sp. Xinjiang]